MNKNGSGGWKRGPSIKPRSISLKIGSPLTFSEVKNDRSGRMKIAEKLKETGSKPPE